MFDPNSISTSIGVNAGSHAPSDGTIFDPNSIPTSIGGNAVTAAPSSGSFFDPNSIPTSIGGNADTAAPSSGWFFDPNSIPSAGLPPKASLPRSATPSDGFLFDPNSIPNFGASDTYSYSYSYSYSNSPVTISSSSSSFAYSSSYLNSSKNIHSLKSKFSKKTSKSSKGSFSKFSDKSLGISINKGYMHDESLIVQQKNDPINNIFGTGSTGEHFSIIEYEECDPTIIMGINITSESFVLGVVFGLFGAVFVIFFHHYREKDHKKKLQFCLVPIGAYFHNAEPKEGVSSFLLACFDTNSGVYQGVTKIETGFALLDGPILEEIIYYLDDYVVPGQNVTYDVKESERCHVWFDPATLWEIEAADFLITSVSRAGVKTIGDVNKGIGLRYPRFVRILEKMGPERASTSDEIVVQFNKLTNDEKETCIDYDD